MKVSVCLACYNGEKHIMAQLDSILPQLTLNDEVIISDDGSTDNTINIITSYRDNRIKILYSNKKNLISNFENALKKATGDIIFLSDQDDIWFKDKVLKYKKYLKKNMLVFSNASMFNGEDVKTSKLFFETKTNKTGILNNLIKVKFLGATLAFKKEVLNRALPFPKNLPMHDIWIGLIAETMGNTFYIDEPLIYYRRHENTASSTGGKSENSIFTKINMRINLTRNLIIRIIKPNQKNGI